MQVEDLGWRPFITSWLTTKGSTEPLVAEALGRHVDKYMDAVLEHKRLHVSFMMFRYLEPSSSTLEPLWPRSLKS